jgi:hypothetical protein
MSVMLEGLRKSAQSVRSDCISDSVLACVTSVDLSLKIFNEVRSRRIFLDLRFGQ